MCPDHQLLSAYYDEELDSEWEKRIEDHLTGCGQCREKIAVFGRLSEDLVNTPIVDLLGSQARSWQIIQAHRQHPIIGFWQRRLSVPIPVVAAAAAAIVLLLGLGLFIRLYSTGGQTRSPAVAVTAHPESGPTDIQVSNLSDIINYLNSQDFGDNVTIQLPKNINQMSIGQPQLLRAADYKRGQ